MMSYRYYLFFALLLAPGSAFAQSGLCDNPQTQAQMNSCSAEQLAEADAALNAVWPKVRAAMRETDRFNTNEYEAQADANMLKAQRAWIDYRDGHCIAVGAQYAGGSIQPLIINSCMAGLTDKRTQELLQVLEER